MREQADEAARPLPDPTTGGAAVAGGLRWVAYGVLDLAAWGVDAVHDEARGYDVVLDRSLFVLDGLPGALTLGLLSALGVAVALGPLLTAPRILGTVVLGVATGRAAHAARGRSPSGWPALLGITAVLAVALLPLRPLVHALGWFSPTAGALLIAAHGTAWAAVGIRQLRGPVPLDVRGPGG